jgi:hypothetical protein
MEQCIQRVYEGWFGVVSANASCDGFGAAITDSRNRDELGPGILRPRRVTQQHREPVE